MCGRSAGGMPRPRSLTAMRTAGPRRPSTFDAATRTHRARPAVLQRVGDQVLQARPQRRWHRPGSAADPARCRFRPSPPLRRSRPRTRRARRRRASTPPSVRDGRCRRPASMPAYSSTRSTVSPSRRASVWMRDAVLLDARRIGDEAVGEVLRRRPDDRDRRAQLVRDGRDELHLLPRETLGAIARYARALRRSRTSAAGRRSRGRGCASARRSTAASSDPARCRATSVHRDWLSNGSGLPLGSVAGRRDHAEEQAAPAIGAGWHRVAQRVGGQADELELIRAGTPKKSASASCLPTRAARSSTLAG